jgi:hypothetical protein
MALFSERMQQCARKLLDIADMVRDACLQQVSEMQATFQGSRKVRIDFATQ